MPDLKQYWQEIRAMENTLPDFVWLSSLGDARRGLRAGSIVEAPASTAARLLHAKLHRLATEAEIQEHLDRQQAAKRDAFHERLREHGIAVTPVA